MNTATALTIAIPTLAVMFGILLNRHDATSIRAEVKAGITQLRNEVISMRDQIHHDMIGLHERLTVVETRQSQ